MVFWLKPNTLYTRQKYSERANKHRISHSIKLNLRKGFEEAFRQSIYSTSPLFFSIGIYHNTKDLSSRQTYRY